MRVLQIEDDAKTAQTVAMILKPEGHDCDIADCGKRALELAGSTGGEKLCRKSEAAT